MGSWRRDSLNAGPSSETSVRWNDLVEVSGQSLMMTARVIRVILEGGRGGGLVGFRMLLLSWVRS